MSSKSTMTRMARISKTVQKYAKLRQELKDSKDYAALQRLPRDASPTRIKNRCQVSGRSRGYYRKFKVSRIALRELALQGLLPGVTKASW